MPYKTSELPFPADGAATRPDIAGAGLRPDLVARYRRIGIAAVAGAALHRPSRPERARPAVTDFMD